MKRLLFVCCLLLLARIGFASDALLPRPPELEPDVQFWIRVYTEVTTNAGFLHDQHKLSIVYETLRFDPDTSPHERALKVDAERTRYRDILLRLAAGAEPQDADEHRVKELWGVDGTSLRLTQAAEDIRFQLGQADRFRAGLVRAGTWETHIGEVLASKGIPAEIAALPHVESSFDPYAYSKVGAAGLWQFMRSTGRRFMRIDSSVDERLDPYRATEAAAQLLSYNYRLLGSWPLAITAYNHGTEGMLRARDQLGTDDIVRIVREYHSPSFGFASRNFYVSFLAALAVSQNPDKYFPGLQHTTEPSFREVKMPASASAASMIRTLGIDRDLLRTLNPALLPTVWNGTRPIPSGYVLRLPMSASRWTTQMLAARTGAPEAPESETASTAATVEAAKIAIVESEEEKQAVKTAKKLAARTEPVTRSEAQAEGPELVPGGANSTSVDPVDYSVASDHTIRVAAAETLGHYADWLGIPASRLRALNHLKSRTPVIVGRRIKLEFESVTPERFEHKRRDYHERIEAAYFSAHRIVGTEVYTARKGDSLWNITQHAVKVPVWLLQQYNPDLDFGNLRPGTQISLPKVEDVTGL